jgi:hypothetical protein
VVYEHTLCLPVPSTRREAVLNLNQVSENNLPPEDVVLQEWLTRSERKLLFVVWYVRDLALLVASDKFSP